MGCLRDGRTDAHRRAASKTLAQRVHHAVRAAGRRASRGAVCTAAHRRAASETLAQRGAGRRVRLAIVSRRRPSAAAAAAAAAAAT